MNKLTSLLFNNLPTNKEKKFSKSSKQLGILKTSKIETKNQNDHSLIYGSNRSNITNEEEYSQTTKIYIGNNRNILIPKDNSKNITEPNINNDNKLIHKENIILTTFESVISSEYSKIDTKLLCNYSEFFSSVGDESSVR